MTIDEYAWLRSQLEKRGIDVPECDPWQYEPSRADCAEGHDAGIEQALQEVALPLMQENEKMREQAGLLIEYLDRIGFDQRFSPQTKYGAAVQTLRSLIVNTK